jgi:hypothetical protein
LPRLAFRDQPATLVTALTESTPVALAEGRLTVEMAEIACARLAAEPKLMAALEGLVEQLAGHRFGIVLKPRVGPTAAEERWQRYRATEEHPLVRGLKARFSAEVISRELVSRKDWRRRFES